MTANFLSDKMQNETTRRGDESIGRRRPNRSHKRKREKIEQSKKVEMCDQRGGKKGREK